MARPRRDPSGLERAAAVRAKSSIDIDGWGSGRPAARKWSTLYMRTMALVSRGTPYLCPSHVTSSTAPGKNSAGSSWASHRSSTGGARPWLAAEKAWAWTTSGGDPALMPARTVSIWRRMNPLSTTIRTSSWMRSKSRTASRKGAVTQSSVIRTWRVVGGGDPDALQPTDTRARATRRASGAHRLWRIGAIGAANHHLGAGARLGEAKWCYHPPPPA